MFGLILNPFRTEADASKFDVLMPLEQRGPAPMTTGDAKSKSKLAKDGTREDEEVKGADNAYSANSMEGLRAEVDADVAASGIDSVYDRKSKCINIAIQDIGMGRYQWQLFCLCGFGWLADNLWLQGIALTLPSLSPQFGISQTQARYTTTSAFIGLCIGAVFWGLMSDVIGRRFAFNMTLFIAGVFGLAVGGAPNWIGVCGMYAALGVGVGGNLPVDGSLFLEFLPFASGNFLTMLSVWWPVGQLIASLIAWGLIPSRSCDFEALPCSTSPGPTCCAPEANMGWRYFNITLGALTFFMFICRFFVFHLFESPKFLLSRGRQAEAVASVHGIAAKNRTKTWLTEDILNEVGGQTAATDEMTRLSKREIIRRQLDKFSTRRLAPLFHTRRLGIMTGLLWFCWTTIGLAYPLFNAFLPQYLTNAGRGQAPTSTYYVYRNYAITSIVGVPGSILACYTVDLPYVGRKGTIAFSTLITAILLFCFTTSTNGDIETALSSLESFWQNISYGVLYAYTPEVFPAPSRGTGTGVASFFNRIAGLCAPIIAANASSINPATPIYISGSLFIAAFLAMCLFPIETRGKQSL